MHVCFISFLHLRLLEQTERVSVQKRIFGEQVAKKNLIIFSIICFLLPFLEIFFVCKIQMIVANEFQSHKFNNKLRVTTVTRSDGTATNAPNDCKASVSSGNGASGGGNDAVANDNNALLTGWIIECKRFHAYASSRYVRPIEKTRFMVNKSGLDCIWLRPGHDCDLVSFSKFEFFFWFFLSLVIFCFLYSYRQLWVSKKRRWSVK